MDVYVDTLLKKQPPIVSISPRWLVMLIKYIAYIAWLQLLKMKYMSP